MKNQLSNSPMKFMIRLSILALVAIATVGCDEDTQQQTDVNQEMQKREMSDRSYQRQPEPEPVQSTEPIDPFYGDCHSYDCPK